MAHNCIVVWGEDAQALKDHMDLLNEGPEWGCQLDDPIAMSALKEFKGVLGDAVGRNKVSAAIHIGGSIPSAMLMQLVASVSSGLQIHEPDLVHVANPNFPPVGLGWLGRNGSEADPAAIQMAEDLYSRVQNCLDPPGAVIAQPPGGAGPRFRFKNGVERLAMRKKIQEEILAGRPSTTVK